jgi:pimeloyl-ACP methyl ester carboxylesterase
MTQREIRSKSKYGEDKFTEVDGYVLHYIEVGKGHPVILIPGSFSTYRAWNRIIPLLSERYRLLALDYLGTGDSDKPTKRFRYTIEEQADLIAKMIRKLGIGKVHLVGGSYGGAIALSLAVRHPDLISKVVSIEGGVVIPENMPQSPVEYFLRYPIIGDLFIALTKTNFMTGALIRLIAGKWYPHMTSDDKKEMKEQLRHNGKSSSRIPWYWISVSHKTAKPFEEEAKSIKVPVLYLYGTESDFKKSILEPNLKFFRTYLPKIKIAGVDGGIHDLEFQKPKEVANLILEFFA